MANIRTLSCFSLSYTMKGLPVLKLLNRVLICKTVVSRIDGYGKAAERYPGCLLRRTVSSLGTFAKTVLEAPADVIRCNVRNKYIPQCKKNKK